MTVTTPDKQPPKFATIESCCTCATLLSAVPHHDTSSEKKAFPRDRWLECCPRVICGKCIHNNPRFETYCPYCQISITDSTLPPGLKEPPSYASSISGGPSRTLSLDPAAPPPYTPFARQPTSISEKPAVPDEPAEDTLHFLNHTHDTVTSLSLRYGVPASVLRRSNNITSDHLILGRRTILIPGSHYKGGVSLSPRPVEGEEEEARKSKIRRWMVACKVHEYDVAVLYLEQAGYDLELAMEAYFADEEWERTHPANTMGRGKKTMKRGMREASMGR
ncbi:hypothetical protein F5X96DRAFT_380922 [Biscogniauxia mediterranea]|nr:hypothetical protein F5X96DRAFT_380922 [Biscogniauxia mediterranea]